MRTPGGGAHAAAQLGLDRQPAHRDAVDAQRRAGKAPPARVDGDLAADVARAGRPGPAAHRVKPGKELVEHLATARQQAVRVHARAAYPCAAPRRLGQRVALEQHHFGEVLAQDAGGQQAGDAGTDDDGAASGLFMRLTVHGVFFLVVAAGWR